MTCTFCGRPTDAGNADATRDGRVICSRCVFDRNFCAICGSVREEGQTEDEQLHYDELRFK